LKVSSETRQQDTDRITTVTVANTGGIAFGIRLKVNKGEGGDEVLPVLWEDNYFSLLPGETRQVSATYHARDLGRATPAVEAKAWNSR